MKKILWLAALMASLCSAAQDSSGLQIVDKLCGCFEVNFKYAETFSPDPAYKYHEREETGGTAELAFPIERNDRKVIIQHLLVVGPSSVVKHWREEWTYESPVIWRYQGDKTWKRDTLTPSEVKGRWTQTVWEVSDEPRYQGFSQFVSLDGKLVWQSTADAPLPRREYSVRNDYNILRRTNRLNITDSGYIHEQDNQKIIRSGDVDRLLVEEKGINSYRRIPEKECAAAKEFWAKNSRFWNMVRAVWSAYTAVRTTISLRTSVDGKMMHEYLMAMAKEFSSGKMSEQEANQQITKTINDFVK